MDMPTLDYYRTHAAQVAARYESIVNGMAALFEQVYPAGSRVLDVGCGSGRDMALLHTMGRDAYGIDASEPLLALAQQYHPPLTGRLALGTLPDCQVPFDGQFDGVLCSAVLMHVPLAQQPAAIDFVRRCLKPGGSFLYSVPTRREDALANDQRDAVGRLFVPDVAGGLRTLCEQRGFVCIAQWANADSLGRDGVAWVSVHMKLQPTE